MEEYRLVRQLVSAMSMLHEEHDHHGPQVASLARALAVALGMPKPMVEKIETGAYLHDIGKILVPKQLLNHPGRLEPADLNRIHQHTTLGWAIVDQAGFDLTICEIVRSHHERYDGNGYPDRLSGEQIPLAARIVAVCDVYAALVQPRSYREAYGPDFARSFVEQGRGKAFDPLLVDLFFYEKVYRALHPAQPPAA